MGVERGSESGSGERREGEEWGKKKKKPKPDARGISKFDRLFEQAALVVVSYVVAVAKERGKEGRRRGRRWTQWGGEWRQEGGQVDADGGAGRRGGAGPQAASHSPPRTGLCLLVRQHLGHSVHARSCTYKVLSVALGQSPLPPHHPRLLFPLGREELQHGTDCCTHPPIHSSTHPYPIHITNHPTPLTWRLLGTQLLLDLCYFVNILLLAYLWVFPSSTWLFRALFALSTGPLAWSVAMFRNSLVLSSISHATSLWLHLSPPLLMWGIRWYAAGDLDSPFVVCETDSCSITEFWHSRGTLVMFGPVIGLYALWLAIHYTVIFIIMWDEIQEKKLYTLYSSSSLQWIVEKGGHQEWKRQLVYFASHAVFALSGCAISMIMWSNFYLHTAYLIIVMLISAYNGATYYMIVFARKYNSEIERRAERKARVQLDTVHMM